MRTRTWLLAIAAALGLSALYPMHDTVSAQSATGIVISEFRFRGPAGPNDEFVELFNAGTEPVNIGGWLVRSSNNVQPPGFFTRATIPANTVINPGCYYLLANTASGGFSGGVTPNATYSIGIADDGGVALTTSSSAVIVDQVGQGTVAAAFGEGQRLPMANTNVNRGFERRPGGGLGHLDTNDNFADFAEIIPGNPQNGNTCLVTQVYLPHEIQGAGSASPIATGSPVNVQGVVTARAPLGFFLQTESGQEDADEDTSEGLFVSASGPALAAAIVGHTVRVAGLVSEAAAMTQLTGVTNVVDLGASALPGPIPLSNAELSEAGSPDQLERFEGMRVTVSSLTAVSGTEAGAFHAVLTGQARPFREPGVAVGDPILPCAIGPCAIPMFDANPERLHVDSDGLEGVAAVSLSTGAVVTDATGPLSSSQGLFTLLADSSLNVSGGMLPSAAHMPLANEFTVASLVLGAAFPQQLAKASLLVRNTLAMPDIIAVQQVPDAAALFALAAAIDADAVASGQPPPSYAAESGFLLKQSGGRVTRLSVDYAGDEPAAPVVLRATVTAPAQLPQTVTVIASRIPPPDPDPAVLAARQAEAESLAAYIQSRQSSDPSEAIIVIGAFNAHRFNDGYADVIGTILGTPASPDQVAIEAHDLVSPDLFAAADAIDPSQRYSSIANGSAQLFDHVLFTTGVAAQFAGVAYPRVNADFPDALRIDLSLPSRLSDRDPVVAYFTFPPDNSAPLFDPPADLTFEALSINGAPVHYAIPTATDNLDTAVAVTCSPGTGSTFELGSTVVNCLTQDVAGNSATTSFLVTVQDTVAPMIAVPDPITTTATSAAGAPVFFTASATDAVTTAPFLRCSRPSGSTFRIGISSNTCYSFDAAGNGVTATFLVTVTKP